MLASLLLVAASAAAATPSQEVPLNDEAQVRDVCSALWGYVPAQDADPAQKVEARNAADARRAEAMAKTYRVEVPSKGFTFGRYLAQDSRLELDGDRPLKAVEGVLTLDVDGIDDVGFSARAEQVSQWSREKKAGTLKLVVVFKPDGPCAGSAQAQAFRLAGHAVSWQLVGSGGAVAAADADGEPAGTGPKSARIERIAMEEEPGVHASDEEAGGNERITGVQSALERCASKAQRTGNVVVQFSVQSGHVREPQVIVDSIRDESVSRCVAQALSGAAISGTSASRGTASIALQ